MCVCASLCMCIEGGIAERQQSIFGCIVCFANLSTCCMPFLTTSVKLRDCEPSFAAPEN